MRQARGRPGSRCVEPGNRRSLCQLDASANSLNMLASAHYSHAELLRKSTAEKHEMLHAKGVNWAKQPPDFKRGRVARRPAPDAAWEVDLEIPIFNRDRAYLDALIPVCA